jgi:hypothetical protein
MTSYRTSSYPQRLREGMRRPAFPPQGVGRRFVFEDPIGCFLISKFGFFLGSL